MIADALTYPFEALSTIVKSSPQKTSAVRVSSQFIKSGQVKSLYKGFSSVPMTSLLPSAAYFFVYEGLMNWARQRTQHLNSLMVANAIPFLASMAGEVAFVSLVVPFDTVQTRMQMGVHHFNYRSFSHGLTQVVNSEGLLRLFTASPIYALQFLTFTPVQFAFYEYFKSAVLPAGSAVSLKNCLAFTIASTVLASVLTNPLNTLIVRFQCEDHSGNKESFRKKIEGIYKRAGVVELNRGMAVRILERTANSVVFLPVYEMTRQHLTDRKE